MGTYNIFLYIHKCKASLCMKDEAPNEEIELFGLSVTSSQTHAVSVISAFFFCIVAARKVFGVDAVDLHQHAKQQQYIQTRQIIGPL